MVNHKEEKYEKENFKCGIRTGHDPFFGTDRLRGQWNERISEQQTAASAEKQTDGTVQNTENSGTATHLKWAVWDISLITYWNDLADAYMEKNPDVEIELVDFGSTDYSNVLATELSGSGTDFDIVTIKDTPSYATLVEKNVLDSLDSYIEKDGVELAKFNGVTDQILVNDSLYMLPFEAIYGLSSIIKTFFDAKGLDYPSNDMTFEEYDALARAITR